MQPEKKPGILDLPKQTNNPNNAGSVIKAAYDRIGAQLQKRLDLVVSNELANLPDRVKRLVEAAIAGAISSKTGLRWDTYRNNWELDASTKWSPTNKALHEIIEEHSVSMIEQLRAALPARKLSPEELERAEAVYVEAFNARLPYAIAREAEAAADNLARQMMETQREALIRSALGIEATSESRS